MRSQALYGLGLPGSCGMSVTIDHVPRLKAQNLQQTAEQLHTIAHCAGEEYHYTYTRKAGVAPERIRHQCCTVVLHLVAHPPDKYQDRGGTDN